MLQEVKRTVSPLGALVKVIMDPVGTFLQLRERVPIWPGYVLQTVVAAANFGLKYPVIMASTMDQLSKQQSVPPEALGFAKTIGLISGGMGVLTSPWITGLILSLVALFFGTFQENKVGYSKYLGMIGYAQVPLAIGSLVVMVLSWPAKTLEEMTRMGTSISLAFLAPNTTSSVLKTFLASLNPFNIWYYALLGLAFASLHRVKWSKSLPFIGTLFVLSLLLTAVMTGMASSFTVNVK